MTPSWHNLKAAGRLFLFADNFKPKFFVCTDSSLKNTIPASYATLPILFYTGPWRYNQLHAWLHHHLGNSCRGLLNTKIRRNSEDSKFSGLVRCGQGTKDNPRGCYDTPFIDIDAMQIDGTGRIIALIEEKHQEERTDPFQKTVLNGIELIGGKIIWNVK